MAYKWKKEWKEIVDSVKNKEGIIDFDLLSSNLPYHEEFFECMMWIKFHEMEQYIAFLEEQKAYTSENLSQMSDEAEEVLLNVFENVENRVFGYNQMKMEKDSTVTFHQWSRDWEHFDWNKIQKNMDAIAKEANPSTLGIDVEELHEYIHWMAQNAPADFKKVLVYRHLVEKGMPEEEAINFINSLDEDEEEYQ